MSFDVGAGGAFGILLSEREDIRALYDEFKAYVAPRCGDNYDVEQDPESMERVPEFEARFRESFGILGIDVPESARLVWTDSDDNRPGTCATEPDQWVLGFGLFTLPSDYPTLSPSFLAEAKWHTWVWGG